MTGPGAEPPGEEPTPFIAGPPPPPPPPGAEFPSGPAGGAPRHGLGAGVAGVVKTLDHWSPWLLAPAAILIAFAVSWLSAILESVRHAPGAHSQYRVFEFFSPGSVDWAVWVLLGVALVAAGQHFDARMAGAPQHRTIAIALMGAAAAVGGSAVINALVELTNFGNGIDDALSGLISYLAVIPLAGIAGWWANHLRQ